MTSIGLLVTVTVFLPSAASTATMGSVPPAQLPLSSSPFLPFFSPFLLFAPSVFFFLSFRLFSEVEYWVFEKGWRW
ncbi:uncharacterized protein DS421_10g312290 [Arachis hypogaea]|nr:uncharacterized protein DS421_10g312290 [Arachis hypogaea]